MKKRRDEDGDVKQEHCRDWYEEGLRRCPGTVCRTLMAALWPLRSPLCYRDKEQHVMDCLHPIAPDDEELLRLALDGEILSIETSKHLEQCRICQQRLAEYKNGNAFLVSRLYRSQCPSGTQLSLYCADLLPPGEGTRITNHLRDCPLCAAEAVDTRQFLADTADRNLLPSPFQDSPILLSRKDAHVRKLKNRTPGTAPPDSPVGLLPPAGHSMS